MTQPIVVSPGENVYRLRLRDGELVGLQRLTATGHTPEEIDDEERRWWNANRGGRGLAYDERLWVLHNFPVASGELDDKHRDFLTTSVIPKIRGAVGADAGTFVTIDGHASPTGSDRINRRVAQRRADAVKAYLEEHVPVSADKLFAGSHGDTYPWTMPFVREVGERWSQNRRATVRLHFDERRHPPPADVTPAPPAPEEPKARLIQRTALSYAFVSETKKYKFKALKYFDVHLYATTTLTFTLDADAPSKLELNNKGQVQGLEFDVGKLSGDKELESIKGKISEDGMELGLDFEIAKLSVAFVPELDPLFPVVKVDIPIKSKFIDATIQGRKIELVGQLEFTLFIVGNAHLKKTLARMVARNAVRLGALAGGVAGTVLMLVLLSQLAAQGEEWGLRASAAMGFALRLTAEAARTNAGYNDAVESLARIREANPSESYRRAVDGWEKAEALLTALEADQRQNFVSDLRRIYGTQPGAATLIVERIQGEDHWKDVELPASLSVIVAE